MKKIAIALATVATIAALNVPAEARGGRNAAIGLGIAGAAIAAGVAANSYNNSYNYYDRGYGYNTGYNNGYYYGRGYPKHSNDPTPVDMNPGYYSGPAYYGY